MTNGLTAQLAHFATLLRLDSVPGAAQNVVKQGIADCIGVMIAGQRESVPSLVDDAICSGPAIGETASLIPSGKTRRAEDAALINGISAHVLDYDDVTLDGHPSAVLVPAIFAQSEVSNSSGKDALLAYIIGYEVWCELLVREPSPLHGKGWHPTAMRGTIAAAAACARLRHLDAPTTATAMAIAASMSAGLVANFGSMTKCFQVGRAAQSGVLAARLAQAGLSASQDALEHNAGFLVATSPHGKADLTLPFELNHAHWHIERQGLNFKQYPVCYAAHRAIDATIALRQNPALDIRRIKRIVVSTGRQQLAMLRNERPKTGLEAKFSMPFAVASAMVEGTVGFAQLSDEFVQRTDIQELMKKVSYEVTSETMNDSAFAPNESVSVIDDGGAWFKSPSITAAKGSHAAPLSETELLQKFTDCLGVTYSASEAAAAFRKALDLESLRTPSEIVAGLRPAN